MKKLKDEYINNRNKQLLESEEIFEINLINEDETIVYSYDENDCQIIELILQ